MYITLFVQNALCLYVAVLLIASLSSNETCLLAEVEDFSTFSPQPAAAADTAEPGTSRRAASTVAAAEPQLSSTDQRLQQAKATIARLYAAPNKLGFGNAGQPPVRPEGLESLSFFDSPQQQQGPIANWATWGGIENSTTAPDSWPQAPGTTGAPTTVSPFLRGSAGLAAPFIPAFCGGTAGPPATTLPVLPCSTAAPTADPWASCGTRLNGQATCNTTQVTLTDGNKNGNDVHSALSSLDAFALRRRETSLIGGEREGRQQIKGGTEAAVNAACQMAGYDF
ncbi:arf1-directed GTPase-activating related protein [Cyclospora cayetanensis]|uniref:Arf1-directed GTPase-activating related protein n=1 Tax=Cyclospora cayetanensis TaxID=88456 RepID=A0A1D3D6B4_9EIME|nr:arf1-directed GTPase-activating related protein [Cyclospora cayetanensis]